jgi:hypothetical protein
MNASASNALSLPESNTPKGIEAFYLRAGARGTPVSLWITQVNAAGAPDFNGKVGEQRVTLRIRNGANGSFLSVIRNLRPEEIDDDGYRDTQVGVANLVVSDRGMAVLAIKLTTNPDKTIWANVSPRTPLDLLVRCGLDLDTLARKKAAYTEGKAARGLAPVMGRATEAVPA